MNQSFQVQFLSVPFIHWLFCTGVVRFGWSDGVSSGGLSAWPWVTDSYEPGNLEHGPSLENTGTHPRLGDVSRPHSPWHASSAFFLVRCPPTLETSSCKGRTGRPRSLQMQYLRVRADTRIQTVAILAAYARGLCSGL